MDEKTKTKDTKHYRRIRQRATIVKLVLCGALAYVLFLTPVREYVPAGLGMLLQLVFYAVMSIGQFFVLMYWLSGTKVEKIMPGDACTVTLDGDYKGQPRLVAQAKLVCQILEGYTSLRQMGGEPLHGILLSGPPGTGKTHLARCMAGTVKTPMLAFDGSRLISMWMGVGALKVRQVFSKAKKLARRYGACIIFVDEIDAVGGNRGGVAGMGAGVGGGGLWGGMAGMGVINTLLACMDGLEDEPGIMGWLKKKAYGLIGEPLPKPDYTVLVIGATNRPQALDPALKRAGRLDEEWYVDVPTKAGLVELLQYYLDQVERDKSCDAEMLAQALLGASPADVKVTVLRRATMAALLDGRTEINMADIIEGYYKTILGTEHPVEDPHEWDEREVAYHEAGHAVMTRLLKPEMFAALISIVRHVGGKHGSILGVVVPRFREQRTTLPLDFLYRSILVSMAGRESANLFMGRDTMGFGGDRVNIQNALLFLVNEAAFGYPAAFQLQPDPVRGGYNIGALPKETLEAIAKTVEAFAEDTKTILEANRGPVEALASLLRERGTVGAPEIETLFEQHPVSMPENSRWRWLAEQGTEVGDVPEKAVEQEG